jgi:hypothetical protein
MLSWCHTPPPTIVSRTSAPRICLPRAATGALVALPGPTVVPSASADCTSVELHYFSRAIASHIGRSAAHLTNPKVESRELRRHAQLRTSFDDITDAAVDAKGQVHTASYSVRDHTITYLLFSGSDPDLRDNGAITHWESTRA